MFTFSINEAPSKQPSDGEYTASNIQGMQVNIMLVALCPLCDDARRNSLRILLMENILAILKVMLNLMVVPDLASLIQERY